MIMIETNGTWREMGLQYAGQAGARLHEVIARYAGWLKADLAKHMPRIQELREQALAHCPELIEETAGMAEGAGLDEMLMFGFRFFNEMGPWRRRPDPACSCIFIKDGMEGPLLGRNSDLEKDHKVATCHTCRPDRGTAFITTTYLGMAAGPGLNSHGLGLVGASAPGERANDKTGMSSAILNRMVLGHCRSAGDAAVLLSRHIFDGTPCNWLVADAAGAAVLVELVPGLAPVVTPMPPERTWLACTNFYISGTLANKHDTPRAIADLDSAYARYGRIAHQLGENIMPHDISGLKRLLIDVAQPGLCQPDTNVLRTAYSQVCDLKARAMHVSAGHPADVPFATVKL